MAPAGRLLEQRLAHLGPAGVVEADEERVGHRENDTTMTLDVIAALPSAARLGHMSATQVQVGSLLRDWRQRRRLSQLELALDADVSARHLSFVETGRSRPSASMVLHLAERLEVPLRERNRMLLAAGHAPAFQSHDLDEPPMAPVRAAIDLILAATTRIRRSWSTAPGR